VPLANQEIDSFQATLEIVAHWRGEDAEGITMGRSDSELSAAAKQQWAKIESSSI